MKNFIFKFLNWRVILGYGLLFGTTILNVFAYRGVELKVTPMIESTGIIWVTILAVFLLGERPTKRGNCLYSCYGHWHYRIFFIDMSKLAEQLKTYADSDYLPMHMPGHKRRMGDLGNPVFY